MKRKMSARDFENCAALRLNGAAGGKDSRAYRNEKKKQQQEKGKNGRTGKSLIRIHDRRRVLNEKEIELLAFLL